MIGRISSLKKISLPKRALLSLAGFVLLLSLVPLTGCGVGFVDNSDPLHNPLMTGAFDPQGRPYVAGPIACVGDQCLQLDKDLAVSAADIRNTDFANQILKARLERFDNLQSKEGDAPVSRLAFRGQESFRLSLELREGGAEAAGTSEDVRHLYFVGHLSKEQGSSVYQISEVVAQSSGGLYYSLSGKLIDGQRISDSDQKEDITLGHFMLKRLSGASASSPVQAETKLYYRSYPSRVRLREKQASSAAEVQMDASTSELQAQVDRIRESQQAQFHHWAVPLGPAFYSIDVLENQGHLSQDQGAPSAQLSHEGPAVLFSIEGPSVLTEAIRPVEAYTSSATDKVQVSSVSLLGRPEDKDVSTFEVSFAAPAGTGDRPTPAALTVLLEVDRETDSMDLGLLDNDLLGDRQFSFLNLNPRGDSSIDRMVNQLNRNYMLPGVQEVLESIKSSQLHNGFNVKISLENFFKVAYNLRPLIEEVFVGFGVTPAMVYLNLVESSYLRTLSNGRPTFPIEVPGSETATGPFQIVKATAGGTCNQDSKPSIGLGLHIDCDQRVGKMPNLQDGRRYLIPSTCGAAKYLASHVKDFPKDATMAFLAYNLGRGGAAAAISCANGQALESSCMNPVGSFSREEYRQFLNKMDSYDYSYFQIAERGLLQQKRLTYVNRILAFHFAAANPTKYGLSLPDSKSVPNLSELVRTRPQVTGAANNQASIFLPPAGAPLGQGNFWTQCEQASRQFLLKLQQAGATGLAGLPDGPTQLASKK